MCGRFTLFINTKLLGEWFNIINIEDLIIKPRYNIAPSQDIVAVVASDDGNRAGMLRWGLVPVWAKDTSIGYKMINARAETVDEKPSYRRLLSRRRCLIPASGFYEWQKSANQKQPYHIQLQSEEPFAFAGLWDRWEHEGKTIHSCTIITTTANELMATIHDRMPVILSKDDQAAWLDRSNQDPTYLTSLLQPYDTRQMKAYPVSKEVGSTKNTDPFLVNPI